MALNVLMGRVSIKTAFGEALIRLALAILRDRVVTTFTRLGYTKDENHVWTKPREIIFPGDPKVSVSTSEPNAIRGLVDTLLINTYKEPFRGLQQKTP